MTTDATITIARACYEACVAKDHAAIEALLAKDFHFTSPLDNRLDRATYFARCWPNSQKTEGFDFDVEVYFGWSIPHEAQPGSFLQDSGD